MKNKNWPLIISRIYVAIISGLFVASLVWEDGQVCYSNNQFWLYGPVILPCYFFDSLLKFLLNPTYLVLNYFSSLIEIPYLLFMGTVLAINTLFVYYLVKNVAQRIKQNG